MGKLFKLSNGGLAPHPDSRSHAVQIRHRLYLSDFKCNLCGISSTRFAKSDNCIMCQRFKIELTRYYVKVNETSYVPWPENIPEALNNLETLDEVAKMVKLLKSDSLCVLHYEPCHDHGHVRVSREDSSQCLTCATLLKPREQALLGGVDVYVSTSKCGGCGKLTLRDVSTKSCLACDHTPHAAAHAIDSEDHRQTADSVMMRENPDMVLSRKDAAQFDMKVYRTGKTCKDGHTDWRYVSTGNCITCLRSNRT